MTGETDGSDPSAEFDYGAPADLYFPRAVGHRGGVHYQHFDSAAEALSYAIEQLGGARLAAAAMETGDDRFDASDIRRLYADPRFPLARAMTGH